MPDTSAAIAAAAETLTRQRFHVHCGETHTPGPCNDGVTRPAPDVVWEQVNYFLAPRYRVVEEDDGWRVYERVEARTASDSSQSDHT